MGRLLDGHRPLFDFRRRDSRSPVWSVEEAGPGRAASVIVLAGNPFGPARNGCLQSHRSGTFLRDSRCAVAFVLRGDGGLGLTLRPVLL